GIVGAQGARGLPRPRVRTNPAWNACRWGPVPEPGWPERAWVAEWMTLGEETWFSRIDPEGDPSLPPIVMVHGMVVSGAYFRPVAAELDTRYRLYIPDLPGYG